MSHYARVRDGIVQEVVTAEPEVINDQEQLTAVFGFNSNDVWVQTSYNTHAGVHHTYNKETEQYEPSEDQTKALRKNYAAVGYIYDAERDAFIPPNPHKGWVLDEFSCTYKAPTDYPKGDGNSYKWDDTTEAWVVFVQGQ
jgi:hypothetical protein